MTSPKAARALLGFIPGAKLVSIEGSGHALMAERPDAVLDTLRAFVAGG
jgi:pimeloyl-ACP methyl ester carboxylesterase